MIPALTYTVALGDYQWAGYGSAKSRERPLRPRQPLVAGFIAGMLAAATLSVTMSLVRLLGLSDLNLELGVGEFITQSPPDLLVWWLGFFGFILAGGYFAMFDVAFFIIAGTSSALAGLWVGFLNLVLLMGLGAPPSLYFIVLNLVFGIMVANTFRSASSAVLFLLPRRAKVSPQKAGSRSRKRAA